jgi:CheY-like chemotaxis protein
MSARILVADDSVTIQKVVELTFSKEDFTLVQARNGEETIRKAKEMRPDVILLDLVMPDKNGYDVCQALRAEPTLQGVPIILLAGTFESYDRERGAKAGADDFVTKPFESQTLIGKVKQFLFARSMNGAAGTKPAGNEVTVKIPRGAPVPVAPPPAALSQDDLWSLLDSQEISAPAAPEVPPAELSLEDLAPSAPVPAPAAEIPALDLGSLSAVESDDAPSGSLTGSLSLDDLLSVEPEEPPIETPEAAPAAAEAPEPLFDLTAEEAAPPLPMVEAGAGEVPGFSMEDLLGPAAESDLPGESPAPLELGELELGTTPEAPPPVEVSEEMALEPRDILEEVLEPQFLETPSAPAEAPPPAPPEAEPEVVLSAAPLVPAEAMTELAQTVTERVARDLTQELREQLLDRIEKIVWEVVPDLAEILIAKEIERIRRLAEEDKTA